MQIYFDLTFYCTMSRGLVFYRTKCIGLYGLTRSSLSFNDAGFGGLKLNDYENSCHT